MSKLRLTLLTRRYCHLCEDMEAALVAAGAGERFELELVDVDEDPELEARYGELVPVLLRGDQELCHYFFSVAALEDGLK